MRYVLLTLILKTLLLWLVAGCTASESADSLGGGDTDADGDTDVDTDSGTPIQYPEALNPFADPNSVMTGPISPPPENFYEVGVSSGGPPGPDPIDAEHPQDDEDDAGPQDDDLDDEGP